MTPRVRCIRQHRFVPNDFPESWNVYYGDWISLSELAKCIGQAKNTRDAKRISLIEDENAETISLNCKDVRSLKTVACPCRFSRNWESLEAHDLRARGVSPGSTSVIELGKKGEGIVKCERSLPVIPLAQITKEFHVNRNKSEPIRLKWIIPFKLNLNLLRPALSRNLGQIEERQSIVRCSPFSTKLLAIVC